MCRHSAGCKLMYQNPRCVHRLMDCSMEDHFVTRLQTKKRFNAENEAFRNVSGFQKCKTENGLREFSEEESHGGDDEVSAIALIQLNSFLLQAAFH